MRDAIKNAKRIVVKVGSSTLCYPNGHLNLERIEHLVRQLSDLANQGKEVILVSSGATGAGLAPLGFKEKPRDLVLRQASAAVGQGVLIHMYERMFREYGRTVAQILLTKEDSTSRHSYLNLRNTLHALLQLHVIPIINENDVVAIEEYKIGDNDTLSATVAGIVESDVLIILSDIDGVGAVRVMITLKDTGESVVEKDVSNSYTSSTGDKEEQDTTYESVTVYDGEEEPYEAKEVLPKVEGVLVVAQGEVIAGLRQRFLGPCWHYFRWKRIK